MSKNNIMIYDHILIFQIQAIIQERKLSKTLSYFLLSSSPNFLSVYLNDEFSNFKGLRYGDKEMDHKRFDKGGTNQPNIS